jgi:hypothetical protein
MKLIRTLLLTNGLLFASSSPCANRLREFSGGCDPENLRIAE